MSTKDYWRALRDSNLGKLRGIAEEGWGLGVHQIERKTHMGKAGGYNPSQSREFVSYISDSAVVKMRRLLNDVSHHDDSALKHFIDEAVVEAMKHDGLVERFMEKDPAWSEDGGLVEDIVVNVTDYLHGAGIKGIEIWAIMRENQRPGAEPLVCVTLINAYEYKVNIRDGRWMDPKIQPADPLSINKPFHVLEEMGLPSASGGVPASPVPEMGGFEEGGKSELIDVSEEGGIRVEVESASATKGAQEPDSERAVRKGVLSPPRAGGADVCAATSFHMGPRRGAPGLPEEDWAGQDWSDKEARAGAKNGKLIMLTVDDEKKGPANYAGQITEDELEDVVNELVAGGTKLEAIRAWAEVPLQMTVRVRVRIGR